MKFSDLEIERFWSKVAIAGPNECSIYHGGWKKNRYGHFGVGGRRSCKRPLAHRVAYFLTFGPTELDVCHLCDTPRCVNPAHLFAGTEVENMQDCKAKGRIARGEGHGGRVLTISTVHRIVLLSNQGLTSREIAERIGHNKQTVANVIAGRRWSWLTGIGANG